jgi:hypothetical protein
VSKRVSGVITTQNLVPAGVATANSAVQISTIGVSSVGVQTTGTYTGALSAQVTVDGVTWVTLGGTATFTRGTTGATSATITSAQQDFYTVSVRGAKNFRVTGLAAMTGTVLVSIQSANV